MAGYSHGMNTDTVRELASQIDSTARELRSIDAAIERVMSDLARQWEGGDFQRFKGWWRDQHRPSLHRLVDSIEGLARSARYNADDQDRASGNVGGSGRDISDSRGFPTIDEGLPFRLFKGFQTWTGAADGGLLITKLVDGTLAKDAGGMGVSAVVGAFSTYMNQREHGWGDARTVSSEVDGFISTGASLVPGGALVYGGTRFLAQPVIDAAENRWDMSGRVANDYAQRAYGVSTVEELAPEQLQEFNDRYDGLNGLWNSTGDQLIAGGRGVGNVVKRGWNALFGAPV